MALHHHWMASEQRSGRGFQTRVGLSSHLCTLRIRSTKTEVSGSLSPAMDEQQRRRRQQQQHDHVYLSGESGKEDSRTIFFFEEEEEEEENLHLKMQIEGG